MFNISMYNFLFFLTSVTCGVIVLSYFIVTFHVVTRIFRFRLYQSSTSFPLLRRWTSQQFFSTHTQSDMYQIPASVRRDAAEQDNISGEPLSLYLLYIQPKHLFLSFVYLLISSLSFAFFCLDADVACCYLMSTVRCFYSHTEQKNGEFL